MKKIIAFLSALVLLASCGTSAVKEEKTSEKIKVVSSIAPLSSIANYVWGENVEVQNMVTIWVSPHAFDLTTKNVVDIEKSDLVITTGFEHIDWFMDKALENKNVLAFSNHIEALELEKGEEHHDEHHDEHEDHDEENHDEHGHDEHHEDEHHDEHGHDDHHHDHSKDTHIWMSIDNAEKMADLVALELGKINPEMAWDFIKNAWDFKAELATIKTDFTKKIQGKTNEKSFIVFHDAYNNLFKSLDIELKKIVLRENIMQSADASKIKEVKDLITSQKVVALFKEPQMEGWEVDKLAEWTWIQVGVLDPIWQSYTKNWYIENLKKNLESIELLYE